MALKPDDRLFLGFEPAPQPFTGRLDDPIIGRNELDLAFKNLGEDVQTTFEREIERICAERREKLELLLEHYHLNALSDAKRWRALASALACEFVRGMHVLKRPPRKRGRPPIWKKGDHAEHLVQAVESILSERKKGIRDAVRQAKKRYPEAWPGIKSDSLVSRYYEAVKVVSEYEAKRRPLLDKKPY
jgi:hypothetical protein